MSGQPDRIRDAVPGPIGPGMPGPAPTIAQRLLLAFFRLVVSTFFRRIEVAGADRVPAAGPVIFVANHPNALVDGALLLTTCGRRPVHFMCHAKLWRYPLLPRVLECLGGVPVRRVEEHQGPVDSRATFDRLFDSLESGVSIGIFPEGVSHASSQMTRLKTGAARIALGVAARRRVPVVIVPCGLTYVHRHRFRSQALVQYGPPMPIGEAWLREYAADDVGTVTRLTERLREELRKVTLNAPDWETLRVAHAARRLYKPDEVRLSPDQWVELSRRFIERYLAAADEPEMMALRADLERYQARLDALGLRDHQLRRPISWPRAWGRILWRSARFAALVPLAAPGALIHLPVGWVAAASGRRLSEDTDDEATLKVMTAVLLLPLVYAALAAVVAWRIGPWWALAAAAFLPLSFFATLRVLEAQAQLLGSTLGLLRAVRLGDEVGALRRERERLVARIRAAADAYADPAQPRFFGEPR
ncbi:MAG: 1-acyl-sn-glycerol-3-phosphate acyltransferase [Acidobacteria bacterium]|nr:1-acyl-sn-glycerol-3-phosphate acyltransferase [Acidobacteriota bacterium]